MEHEVSEDGDRIGETRRIKAIVDLKTPTIIDKSRSVRGMIKPCP